MGGARMSRTPPSRVGSRVAPKRVIVEAPVLPEPVVATESPTKQKLVRGLAAKRRLGRRFAAQGPRPRHPTT
jgi:hypothetical protein